MDFLVVLLAVLSLCSAEKLLVRSSYSSIESTDQFAIRPRLAIAQSSHSTPISNAMAAAPQRLSTPVRHPYSSYSSHSSPNAVTSYSTPAKSRSTSKSVLPPLPHRYSSPRNSYSAPTHLTSHRPFIGQPVVPILRDDREQHQDGSYSFSLETGDGVRRQEKAIPVYTKDGRPSMAVAGSYSFTLPDGRLFELSYIADENGFQPQSSFLPVAPAFPHPIPAHALEQIERGRREHEARARKDRLKPQSFSSYATPSTHSLSLSRNYATPSTHSRSSSSYVF